VITKLRERPYRWSELAAAIRAELWRSTHLNEMIRELRRDGTILAERFSGKFSARADPLLRLP